MNLNTTEYSFKDKLLSLRRDNCISDFDCFIINEMGVCIDEYPISLEKRKEAFKIFRLKTNKDEIASFSTMKRWFGIGKKSIPSRSCVQMICLSLGLGVKEAEKYLTVGLGQTSFIYNSFKEILWLYCLENKLGREGYYQLENEFLKMWKDIAIFEAGDYAKKIKKEFEIYKKKPSKEFLEWVFENRNLFNEYNEKIDKLLHEYSKKVNDYVKKDSKDSLDMLLLETDYDRWSKYRNKSEDKHESLKKYVTSIYEGKRRISEDGAKTILELSRIVYSKKEKLVYIYSEIFPAKDYFEKTIGIKRMTLKRLSDIYNNFKIKLRYLEVCQLKEIIKKMDKLEACPQWLCDYCKDRNLDERGIFFKDESDKTQTNEEILLKFDLYLKENKRRCIHLTRNDVLPILHYVSQHKYLNYMEKNNKEYDCEKAKEEFIKISNDVLKKCKMELINENYCLDKLFLASYTKEDMYSYLDMIEEMKFCNI